MNKLFAAFILPVAVGVASQVIADGADVDNRGTNPPNFEAMSSGYEVNLRRAGATSDLDLTSSVRQAIASDRTLSSTARKVMVSAQGSAVMLSGQVQSVEEKSRVVALVQKMPNVEAIDDRMVVRNP
jgi:hypothetical protein